MISRPHKPWNIGLESSRRWTKVEKMLGRISFKESGKILVLVMRDGIVLLELPSEESITSRLKEIKVY